MNILIQITLLLSITVFAFGSDVPKTVSFPNDSEENFKEFVYEKIKVPAQVTPTKKHKRPQKMTFRIDSSDIPCVNTTMSFCEEVKNQTYPTKYVESVLANTDTQTYKNYFNKTLPKDETLGLRLSSDGPIELCISIKRHIYPQLAMDVQSEWRFVINQNNYHQPIRVEVCQKKKSKCLFDESLPISYVSSCTQKYVKMPLLSLGENGEIESYDYEFPSFCQCEIQYSKPETKRSGGRRA